MELSNNVYPPFDLIPDDIIVDILYTLLEPLKMPYRINELKTIRSLGMRFRDVFDNRLKNELITQIRGWYSEDTISYYLTDKQLFYLSSSIKSLILIDRTNITANVVCCLTKLKKLEIYSTVRKITNFTNLTNLQSLKLGYESYGDDAALLLPSSLIKLNLHSNGLCFTDDHLSKLVNLTKLKLVHSKQITDNGIRSLPNLKKLVLFNNLLITKDISDSTYLEIHRLG